MSLFKLDTGLGVVEGSTVRYGNTGLDSIKSVDPAPVANYVTDIDTGLGFNRLDVNSIQLANMTPARYDDGEVNKTTGYNRIDLESVNVLNGEVTYGSNRGDRVEPTGIVTESGVYADDAIAKPTEVVITDGSAVPSVETY